MFVRFFVSGWDCSVYGKYLFHPSGGSLEYKAI